MSDVTIAQFADVLKIPVEKLISQLDEAGIAVRGADDVISDDAKRELLTHLRRAHGHDEGAAAASPRKITLSRRSQSEIKVASAQGRAKTVTVEVRRKRTYVNRDVLEQENKVQQDELDRQRQEEQAKLDKERADRDAVERAEREKREKELADAEAVRKAEEEARRAAEQAVKDGEKNRLQDEIRKRDSEARARKDAASKRDVRREVVDELVSVTEDEVPEEKPALVGRQELHVSADVSGRRKKKKSRRRSVSVQVDSTRHGFERPTAPVIREVPIPETIKVGELAQRMAVKSNDVIRSLMKLGVMATINQAIDQDTAALVVEELGPHRQARAERRSGADADSNDRGRCRRGCAAAAGGHDHGPRGPRQDVAAGLHPAHQDCRRRSWRHHPAHRRLSRRDAEGPDHVPGYAGSRGIHRHAGARRAGHRHRRAGRGRR